MAEIDEVVLTKYVEKKILYIFWFTEICMFELSSVSGDLESGRAIHCLSHRKFLSIFDYLLSKLNIFHQRRQNML